MADDDDSAEQRTEPASERRLHQAFEEGDIPLSREAVTAAALLAGLAALFALAAQLQARLTQAIGDSLRAMPGAPFSSLPSLLLPAISGLGAVAAAPAVAALAATFVQTRGQLWEEKAEPDLSRVFDSQRFLRPFTRDFFVDLLVSLVKVAAVGGACWLVLRAQFWSLTGLLGAGSGTQLQTLFGPLWSIAVRAGGVILAFAALDVALVRFRYAKRHRMTKEEVRREVKEDEGDPLIRGARRRRHRELVKRNALKETQRADALIVNPTHIAIAVRYRRDEGHAPRVIAKGKGILAEAMREVARGAAIPIVENVPLARLLYRKVKVGGMVPQETYKAVAAVLAVVYRMTGRAPGGADVALAQVRP